MTGPGECPSTGVENAQDAARATVAAAAYLFHDMQLITNMLRFSNKKQPWGENGVDENARTKLWKRRSCVDLPAGKSPLPRHSPR